MKTEYAELSSHEGLQTMSEAQNKALAGVGKPMNEVPCLSSRLNFAKRKAEKAETRKAA